MANPQYVTLVADTVSTLTLDSAFDRIEILVVTASASTDPVYFRLDGTNPALATAGSTYAGAAAGSAVEVQNVGASTSVKLISHGTPVVQVRGIDT